MSKDDPKIEITKYYMSIHFGICVGPVDYLSNIYVGDKTAWSGRYSAAGTFDVDKDELFGGKKKEGGVSGKVTFLPGRDDQLMPSFLASKFNLVPSTMPAYRGMSTIFFSGGDNEDGFYWSANTPYLKTVWAEVSRTSLGYGNEGLGDQYARIYHGLNGPASFYFLLDRSMSLSTGEFNSIKNAVRAGLDIIEAFVNRTGMRVDVAVRFYSTGSTGIERTDCDAADFSAIRSFITAANRVTGGDVNSAMEFVEDWFIDTLGVTFSKRAVIFVTDSNTEDSMTAASEGPAADMLDWNDGHFNIGNSTAVDMYAINYNTTNTTWTSLLDNTPEDGIPIISGSDDDGLTDAVTNILRANRFDSNPAHMIYECLTNTSWGAGFPVAAIDIGSFEDCGLVLYGESFGLSMMWVQQTTVEAFVSEILDHIEATLFTHPRTGLMTLKLIRADYDEATLPVFDQNNSVVRNFKRKTSELINELVVTWTNPLNEEEETRTVQNDASIVAQGAIVSDGRNYYGIRKANLAVQAGYRDLRAASYPVASCDFEVDRTAWDLVPGDVIKITSPEDSISEMVMRVGPIDYGRPGALTIKAALSEDIFGLSVADYSEVPPTEWEDTSEFPSPAEFTYLFTLNYYLAAHGVDSAVIVGVAEPVVFAGILAGTSAYDTFEYDLWGDTTTPAGTVVEGELGERTITSHATLTTALVAEATSVITGFTDRTNGEDIEVGGLLFFGDGTDAEVEYAMLTVISGTTYTVWRGVLDTVPRAWPIGTPVWFLTADSAFADNVARSEAETVEYKILTRTSAGRLDPEAAPEVSVELIARPYLPTRPANVKVDGVGFSTGAINVVGVDPIPVTWSERNRLTEDTVLLPWTGATVTPEAGQTNRVIALDNAGNELVVHDGITGTSFALPASSFTGTSVGIVRVESERDGLISLQGHELRVIVESGYGFGYGLNYGGA